MANTSLVQFAEAKTDSDLTTKMGTGRGFETKVAAQVGSRQVMDLA